MEGAREKLGAGRPAALRSNTQSGGKAVARAFPPSRPTPSPTSPPPTCSTRVKQARWCWLGLPKCMVRVMSVVPQSNWPPLSSSSSVDASTVRQVPGWAR